MLIHLSASFRRWRRRLSRAEWAADRLRLTRAKEGSHAPGLLLIQIDGLAREQLEHALQRGRMPFMSRLLHRAGGALHTFYSGMPATTPAVQAELYYGVRTAVPAFSFLDPEADGVGIMLNPEWAKRVEARLAANGTEGLLTGGSSWSNIYTGGASQAESHFCGASIGLGDMWRTHKIANIFLFAFLHSASFLRLLALLPLELVIALVDALRGIQTGRSAVAELKFVVARIFICVGLRELVTLGAKIDLARGLPIIHVNFLGYDEQSHRRGPSSRFAHWTLKGIDRSIRQLHRAARRSDGRDYEVWVFSDHGQIKATPFERLAPGGLEALVHTLWPSAQGKAKPAETRDQDRLSQGIHLASRRRRAAEVARAELTPFELTEVVVACMGPVGHVYCKRPLTAADDEALVAHLLAHGVPGVLRVDGAGARWQTRDHTAHLPDDTSLLRGAPELVRAIASDLVALAHHPAAGDLICLGWAPDGRSVSFAREHGAHCGPSPQETQGFLLLPPASVHLLPAKFVRPDDLRLAALRQLGRRTRPQHVRRTTAPTRLRVVTYNTHYCKGLDGRFSPERIARVLRDLHPDVVALQEVDCGRARSRGEDQLAFIAGELGLHHLYCPSINVNGERYGHGLLAPQPLTLVRQVHLPTGGGPVVEPRDAVFATTTLAGRSVALIGTHLGLTVSERTAQIARLLEADFLGGIRPDQPAIFLGDLNLSPGGKLYRQLVGRWTDPPDHARFLDVQAHAPNHVAVKTFPSFLPLRQLDHIFVTPQFTVEAVQAPANELTRRASDHLPLVADLRYHA